MKNYALLIILLSMGTLAQAQFIISAEYRIRAEFRDGYKSLNDTTTSPAFVTTQRTRLNLDYNTDKLKVYFSIQDVRAWGEVKHATDRPSIDIHQAYVQYKINELFAVKLGRQEVSYDNKRFLGVKNWNNVAVSHDIGIFQFKKDKFQLHTGFAYNNDTDKQFESDYDLDYYKELAFLWINQKFNDDIELSVMNIYDGNQKSADYKVIYPRGTSGLLAELGFGSFSLTASSYFQYGESKTGLKTAAYFFHLKPQLKISDKFNLALGIDYFSGDKDPNDNKLTSFSNLYGDGHGYYGHMDYFTDVQKHTKDGGLNDTYLTATVKASEKISLIGTVHNFMFTTNVTDYTDAANPVDLKRQLGTELDLQMKYDFYSKSSISIGYSAMLAQKSMEYLKGGSSDNLQHWLWISIQFKPEFLNTDKLTK